MPLVSAKFKFLKCAIFFSLVLCHLCFDVLVFIGLFGIKQYGVDINGYVRNSDKSMSIWIQRRAYNKQTWPGKLDNMVSE